MEVVIANQVLVTHYYYCIGYSVNIDFPTLLRSRENIKKAGGAVPLTAITHVICAHQRLLNEHGLSSALGYEELWS